MLAAAVAVLGSLAWSGAARADHPPAAAERAEPPSFDPEKVLGEGARTVEEDLYRVPVRKGRALFTHGPDLALAGSQTRQSGFAQGDPERSPVCGGDYYQHVLYGRLAGSPDNYGSAAEQIRAAIRRTNAVLNQDSLASGGPTADLRVLCDGSGKIAVGRFTASGTDFSSIVAGARLAGYDLDNVDYTIFFEGSAGGACGVGSYYDDERLTEANYNNDGGGYAIAYDGCWFNATPMHEIGHTQGAVQYGAPYSTGSGGHCNDEIDVMCYSPDGGDLNQGGTILRCNDRNHFDCGYDTYFDSRPEAGEYLASHWNLGSELNRFIAFGAAGNQTNTPPSASFAVSCEALRCSFSDTSTDGDGSVAARSWRFGDGSTAVGQTPQHAFAAPGTYEVTLTVSDDDDASASTARSITVVGADPAGGEGGSAGADGIATGGRAGVARLPNRKLRRARSELTGGWRYFKLKVPRKRAKLDVRLTGPGCRGVGCDPDLDLYLSRKRKPTVRRHACAPTELGSRERCKVRNPKRGRWYVGVHSYEASSPASFRIKAVHKKRR